jgi:hypothetical protein
LREAFTPFFETYAMDQEFRCVELVVAGHWAFARGTEINKLTPKEGGEAAVGGSTPGQPWSRRQISMKVAPSWEAAATISSPMDLARRSILWTFYYWFSWVESSATILDGTAYVGSPDIQRIFAIDVASGSPQVRI